jgi:hypothetical protein
MEFSLSHAEKSSTLSALPGRPIIVPRLNFPAKGLDSVAQQRRLNPQQLKDLSEELAALTEQQSDARMTEVYVRMTPQEVKAFDLRTERISRIHVILSEHDAKR